MVKKLNIGCGNDIKEGFVNLDIIKRPGVDIVHDLNKLPLPFRDESFDYILAKDVLEHINDYVGLLKELHRILKKKGIIKIVVPHYKSRNAYTDPTHKHFFAVNTLKFFKKSHNRNYYFDFSFEEVIINRLTFHKNLLYFYNYIIEILVNINDKIRTFYENSVLNIFPSENLIIIMKK